MKKPIFLLILSFAPVIILAQSSDSAVIKSIFNEALTDNTAYKNLEYLCTEIGGRLCGSPQAAAAVAWSGEVMKKMNTDSVYLQKVMVHHWYRGEKETAEIVSSVNGSKDVRVCALGESIGTPESGIRAGVVEVKSLDELKSLGEKQVKGKIVFFNRAMNPAFVNTGNAYGDAAWQRTTGAVEAAKLGAVGAVIRSLTLAEDTSTHTGIMHYDSAVTKIPAVAVSTLDANTLSDWLKTDPELKFHFRTSCKFFPETESYNVTGEIRGSDFPDEVIVVGGHLDSWDNGEGAHDDGVGCVQSIEVLRLFLKLNIKPRHTIRAVMFMDEESAQRGGKAYAALVKEKNEKHIAAIESDAGGFTPKGFSVDAPADTVAQIQKWKDLLLPYGIYNIDKGGSGVDIHYLKNSGIACIGLLVDTHRYFNYHHSDIDLFTAVNKHEMQLGSAAMASLVYLLDKYGLK